MTVGVERQHGDIEIELHPYVRFRKQITFYIRSIKNRNLRVVCSEVLPDFSYCFGSGKVADNRNDEVVDFEIADGLIVLLTGKKARWPILAISFAHQLGKCRHPFDT